MPQLHLSVNEQTAQSIQRAAQARGLSVSKYLSEFFEREAQGAWPADFFDRVVAKWQGNIPERPEQGPYEQREEL